MTKSEALDFMDKVNEWFPQCTREIKQIKYFIRRSSYKGKEDGV